MLPAAKRKPVFDFMKEKILLYGDWKVGKTTLFASMPFDILFIAAEKGHNKVDAYVSDVETWAEFESVMKEIKTSTKFPMVCVDTIEALWYMYLRDFLEKNKVEYEGDGKALGYGKGFKMLVRGFVQQFFQLQNIGKGFVLLAHELEEKYEENDKDKVRSMPNLPKDKDSHIRDTICGVVDYILYMTMGTYNENGKPVVNSRLIHTAPSSDYVAGSRYPLIDPIGLVNDDPKASAKRLVNAYLHSAKSCADTAPQKPQKEDK